MSLQKITVRDTHGQILEGILITGVDNFLLFQAKMKSDLEKGITELMTCPFPQERWDHVELKHGNHFLRQAWIHCSIKGGVIIEEMSNAMISTNNRMGQYIIDGRQLIVNSNGGYAFLSDDMEILSQEDYDHTKEEFQQDVIINNPTFVINLENDPKLEEHSIEFMTNSLNDNNYSYITCLRSYNKEALVSIFKDFKKNGGELCYVYTTGLNVAQMYDYAEALVEAGIKTLIMEFSTDPTPEALEWFKEMEQEGKLNMQRVDTSRETEL